jgi:hypothetical protein
MKTRKGNAGNHEVKKCLSALMSRRKFWTFIFGRLANVSASRIALLGTRSSLSGAKH